MAMPGVYRNSVISGLFLLVRHLLAFSSLRVDLPFYLTFPNFRIFTFIGLIFLIAFLLS